MSTAAVSLALYQPDIPQNTGTLLRTAACLGVDVAIIEPCGFVLDDKRLRRAGMDYLDGLTLTRHASWSRFRESLTQQRLVLMTTAGDDDPWRFRFRAGDIIVLGRESAGAPQEVHDAADARLRIPLAGGMRSLNVAQAGAIVLAEALRQLHALPTEPS